MTRAILVASLFVGAALGAKDSEHLHWSEEVSVSSPNGIWELHVKRGRLEDGPADVYLSRQGRQPILLFKLDRDADVYWEPSSRHVAIVNEHSSNRYQILLFDLDRKTDLTRAEPSFTEMLWSDIRGSLANDDNVVYFFPRFSRWLGPDRALLAVGVVTIHGNSGPFTPHCFGFVVKDGDHASIKRRVTEANLVSRYHDSCQIWP